MTIGRRLDDHAVDPAILRIAERTRARMAACFRPGRRIATRRRPRESGPEADQTEM